jgi:hypothetical protein
MSAGRWQNACTIARLAPAYLRLLKQQRTVPLAVLALTCWRTCRVPSDASEKARVIACVVRLTQLLGTTERHCVARSLLLYRELSRAGASPCLCVGLRKRDTAVEGHAWVELEGRPVAERDTGDARFEATCRFGRGGHAVAC